MEKKFKIATHIQNALVKRMRKNINRLKQDKSYRHGLAQKKSKERTKQLNERREFHGVTKSWLEGTVKNMQKHFQTSALTPKGKPTKKTASFFTGNPKDCGACMDGSGENLVWHRKKNAYEKSRTGAFD